ncbi:MAG: lipocalin family protein [Vicinamibacterales bacterium]
MREIARFPNRFQRRCAGEVLASYTVRTDGRVEVVNRCRGNDGVAITANGVARVVDGTGAKLKVRFAPALSSWLPLVWGDYWIIGLADDYSWAVVGSADRKYLWILARAAALTGEPYERALASARDNGFAVEQLVATAGKR